MEQFFKNIVIKKPAVLLNKMLPKFYKSVSSKVQYNTLNLPEIPCHYYGLFIRHDGNVYPCCDVWNSEYLKIGHINDSNLIDLIKTYDKRCYCQAFKLRKALPAESMNIELLNIEVSLMCQGNCAMCCVEAPSWRGEYCYYNELRKLIDIIIPKRILIQGGEVLIQKKALEWISDTRKAYPIIEMNLVTNGNVGIDMIEKVEELFDRVTISIVGFTPQTYKTIMGLEFNKLLHFAEELVKRKKIRVVLKYLLTPINTHEASLFLDWAIHINSDRICFSGASNSEYINPDAPFNYWQKIFERTSKAVQSTIVRNIEKILEHKIMIAYDPEPKTLFEFDEGFIKGNGLENNMIDRTMSRLFYPRRDNFNVFYSKYTS